MSVYDFYTIDNGNGPQLLLSPPLPTLIHCTFCCGSTLYHIYFKHSHLVGLEMQLVICTANPSVRLEEDDAQVVVDDNDNSQIDDNDGANDCDEAAEIFGFNMDDPVFHFGDPDVELPISVRPFTIRGSELTEEFMKGTAQHSFWLVDVVVAVYLHGCCYFSDARKISSKRSPGRD